MGSAVLPLRAPFRRGVPLAVPLVLGVVAAACDRPQPPAPPPPHVAVLYEVALLGARARLAESEVRLYTAERRLRRLLGLLAYGAVAKVEVDEAAAVVKQAQAAVADGQAAVGQARKDLDDTVAGPHYYTSIPGTPSFAPPKVGLRRPS